MISKIKYYTFFIFIVCFNSFLFAAPNGANVTHGSVNISQQGSDTIIKQNTDKAIINWNSFDINKGENVKFNQNSSSSIILNRVTNGLPTNIFGNISANGNVFLINKAGILVGNGANINTHSFLVSTANINDNDFINNKYIFNNAVNGIVNSGNIHIQDGGYAVLMGKTIENNGIISARMGKIYLSSGESFRMDMSGNDLIGIAIDKGISDALISNSGHIYAEGGTIVMSAKNASDIIQNAVNNTGVIDASSISYEGGRVILGAENGNIINAGEINVSSDTENGGTINVKANNILNTGSLYANGYNGGYIDVFSNDYLQIKGSSLIYANGIQDAGNIKFISKNRAESYYGSLIEASAIYGNGGFIEFSGYGSIYAFGNFNTLSKYGQYGNLLFDPSNVYIGDYSSLADNENNVIANDGNTYIDIKWLSGILTNNSYTIQTQSGAGAGDITLNGGVAFRSTGLYDLELIAANNINLLGSIDMRSSLILHSGNSINGNNSIKIIGNISANAYSNIELTQLDITGKSSYISSYGDVHLVGGNIGKITKIQGDKVSVEATSNGIIKDESVENNMSIINANDIVLKANGKIDIEVDTTSLSAESQSDSIEIRNMNENETKLIKYYGKDGTTYTQDRGSIDLSDIPENAIDSELTIMSKYGTVKAVDRLETLKNYKNLIIDANTIHFTEHNNNLLTLDVSFLGNKTANKYIFETGGDIDVNLGGIANQLLNSGIELISNNGSIKSISDINATYFSATAFRDIDVSSLILGGISLNSINGNINYEHKGGPISIRGLKALNGYIDVNTCVKIDTGVNIPGININQTLNTQTPTDIYISGLASNNPIKISTSQANVISISGSGQSDLDLDITNNNPNPYQLSILNDKNIILNANNNNFNKIKLESKSNLYFSALDNGLRAEDIIFLSANRINNHTDLSLQSKAIYINQISGNNTFLLNAEQVDINGNNINVILEKEKTLIADIDRDDYSIKGGNINISSQYDISLKDKAIVNNLNISTKEFAFDLSDNHYGTIQGNNIVINAKNDITGYGKILADKVSLTASTIGSTSNILVMANYGYFKSTAIDRPENDILININTNNWFDKIKSYQFEVSGQGNSYLNGKPVNYKIYDMVKNMQIRNAQPIEETNINQVSGDDLIKGGRLQDTSELVTVEDNKTQKATSVTKKNKSVEIK